MEELHNKTFFTSYFKEITLKNRIVMSPMCMYLSMKNDGMVTTFHLLHYVSRAVGQVGLIIVEETAVQLEGRTSEQDLGIWNDEHVPGLKELNKEIHSYGAKSGIQLGHAGRKAQLSSTIYASLSLPFNETSKNPIEMTVEDINTTVVAYKNGARRAS